jgi:hypothetical protein
MRRSTVLSLPPQLVFPGASKATPAVVAVVIGIFMANYAYSNEPV